MVSKIEKSRTWLTSDGELRAQFRCDSTWTPGLRIDGTPERTRLRQELAIASAPDFGEPFEGEPGGFAHPCAKHDFVAKRGRRLVVDFVAQHNPANHLLSFGAGDCSPMRGGNVLDPTEVDGVIDVILLVDIAGQN